MIPHLEQIIFAATEAAQHAETNQSVLGTLGINWKLFVAQLVNFGIILFIFWKWIAGPLGKTLTERQNKIEQGLKHSEEMELERKKFDAMQIGEMQKARTQAEQIISNAAAAAEHHKKSLMAEAQTQAEKLIVQAKASIESEKERMLKEVKQEVATLVVMASEKILREKLDPKKDHELITASLKGVKKL